MQRLSMNRRAFLKGSCLAGVVLGAPLIGSSSNAAVERYEGPYWLFVHAAGAWDPRFLFDPIASGEQNRYYTATGTSWGITYADWPVDVAALGLDTTLGYEALLMSNREFVEKHGARFTVLNGVDTSTNNHEAGTRAIWSGQLLGDYPAFGALVASVKSPNQPMPFISNGGYDATASLVPLARIGSPDTLAKIAFPAIINPTDLPEEYERYHTDETVQRIRAAQAARLEEQRSRARLPRVQTAMDALANARGSSGELARLEIPATLFEAPGNQLDDLERMVQGGQLAMSAFRTGMAVTATLSLGGFDTHANHDRDQPRQIAKLLKGIDLLLAEADAAGIGDRLYVVVGSDFGRGPTYNSENDNAGKDHWPITSFMVAGPGVPGARTIGATDASQNAVAIDPSTLQPSGDGVILTPEIIHSDLRRVAGITDAVEDYPLGAAGVTLFG